MTIKFLSILILYQFMSSSHFILSHILITSFSQNPSWTAWARFMAPELYEECYGTEVSFAFAFSLSLSFLLLSIRRHCAGEKRCAANARLLPPPRFPEGVFRTKTGRLGEDLRSSPLLSERPWVNKECNGWIGAGNTSCALSEGLGLFASLNTFLGST